MKRSSNVGRGVDGGGGTTTCSDGRLELDLCEALSGEKPGLGSSIPDRVGERTPISALTVSGELM